MKVTNVHFRNFRAPAAEVGALIDTLASANDLLWPREAWPAMAFDRPLGVEADGGHGPVRYSVVQYQPGRSIVFRFKAPAGFDGTHRFDVLPAPEGCELRHTLEMDARGTAVLSWPLVFRGLHDALVEDAMAKAQAMVGEEPTIVPWPAPVRLLRRLFSSGRPRPQLRSYRRSDRGARASQDVAQIP